MLRLRCLRASREPSLGAVRDDEQVRRGDCSFLEETSRLLPFDRGALAYELDENWNCRQ